MLVFFFFDFIRVLVVVFFWVFFLISLGFCPNGAPSRRCFRRAGKLEDRLGTQRRAW